MISRADDPAGELQLIPGETYRRRSLHEHFDGQRQGGISTPSKHPIIMLFTGTSGVQHGYEDGWSGPVFCYFGEGQEGDMPWVRGNVAIRDHAASGRDLHLFQNLMKPRSYVRYIGQFFAESWDYRQVPDRTQTMRRGIVFHLVPATMPIAVATQNPESVNLDERLASLKRTAEKAGAVAPERELRQVVEAFVRRSVAVRDYALARAKGTCECCDLAAPFKTKSGTPYLEVHHIRRLSDGGPDRPDAVAAICPNCHRAAHFSADAAQLNIKLLGRVRYKERRS